MKPTSTAEPLTTTPGRRPSADAPRPAPSARRLSVLDAAFLYFERANQHMIVGCLAELEGGVAPEALRALISERLCAIPRYVQRPVRATLDLERPTWEDDPDFDVARHVRHIAVPAPGGARELHALVDDLFATPLDPDHPLWEVYLIESLANGGAALLFKTHHCMIDGVSGAQVLDVLTDPVATSRGNGRAAAAPARRREPEAPAASGGILGTWARALWPAAAIQFGRDLSCALTTISSLVTEPSTPLPFNGPLSGSRRIVWADISLDDVMAVRAAAGCKVNDVVLAIVGGALHRYLEVHGVATRSARVRVVVPVSVRSEGDKLSLGNRVAAMLPTLPVGPQTPLERLRRVAEETRRAKESGQARAAGLLIAIAGAIPAPVEAAIGRFSPEWPFANTICTNVPGPADERSLLGRRITAVHPFAPLFQSMGLEFAVMSYASRISIAAVADGRLVRDPERIREALLESAAELCAAHRDVATLREAARGEPSVGDLMTHDVATVHPDDTLLSAHRLMQERRIRHLPVVDGDRRLVGILTHRDLLAAQPSSLAMALPEARTRTLARGEVADVMETHVSAAVEDEPAAQAGLRMARQKIGCLPVVTRAGRLVGIVTADDYLRWAAEAMQAAAPAAAAVA